jgi:hypothetical protein
VFATVWRRCDGGLHVRARSRGPALARDRASSVVLLDTLHAYLDQGANMNATAAAIYAHRHTIAYRLGRIDVWLPQSSPRRPVASRPLPEGGRHAPAAAMTARKYPAAWPANASSETKEAAIVPSIIIVADTDGGRASDRRSQSTTAVPS